MKTLIAGGLLMLVTLLPFSSFHLKGRMYSYDTQENYLYNFRNADASLSRIPLRKGNLTLPMDLKDDQTIFLKLRIDTRILGKCCQPSVTIKTTASENTQYFEHNASGIRYINLSSCIKEADRKISLEGTHVSIPDQMAELIICTTREMSKARVMIISPHPDDAEIAAYGLYSKLDDPYIITITAGDSGEPKYEDVYEETSEQFLKKGELRTWNSISIPLLAGVPHENVINMGYYDQTLKKMFDCDPKEVYSVKSDVSDINTFRKQNISTLATKLHGKANWSSLVNNLEILVNEIKPDIIVTPHPEIDTHVDHIYSTLALFEALKNINYRHGDIFFYTNHHTCSEYYPYGEQGGVVSMPPNFNPDFYMKSIYSFPLNEEMQSDKLFALEAMHDLRPDMEWNSIKGALKIAAENAKRDILGLDQSYYKRAIRSNELFFIVPVSDIYSERKLELICGVNHIIDSPLVFYDLHN